MNPYSRNPSSGKLVTPAVCEMFAEVEAVRAQLPPRTEKAEQAEAKTGERVA